MVVSNCNQEEVDKLLDVAVVEPTKGKRMPGRRLGRVRVGNKSVTEVAVKVTEEEIEDSERKLLEAARKNKAKLNYYCCRLCRWRVTEDTYE